MALLSAAGFPRGVDGQAAPGFGVQVSFRLLSAADGPLAARKEPPSTCPG